MTDCTGFGCGCLFFISHQTRNMPTHMPLPTAWRSCLLLTLNVSASWPDMHLCVGMQDFECGKYSTWAIPRGAEESRQAPWIPVPQKMDRVG